MPSRLCSVPRCGKILPEGQLYLEGCTKCTEREELNKPWARKERLRFYGTSKWQKLRAVKLAENPVCEYCNEALAVEVDHVESAAANRPDLWYDWNNLKSTCKRCHQEKTARKSAETRKKLF